MLNSWDSPWRYPVAALSGMVSGGLIASILATAFLMLRFGETLNSFEVTDLWFTRYAYSTIAFNPAVERLFWIIMAVPTALFVLLGLTSVHRGALTAYDNAHFQSRSEMRRNKMIASLDQNGFIFGKLGTPRSRAGFVSATPERFPHAMMVAPTGRGKGVGFVLPNLLHFQGSAVVLDVKGENFEKTSIHREKALENRIWYFSPFDYVQPEGAEGPVLTRTHRFNPLARIAGMPSAEQQFTAINAMADLFLVVEAVSAQSFFQAGRSLFVAACLYAIEKQTPTIGAALRIMSGGGNKKDSYLKIAQDTANPTVAEVFLTMADETDKILDSYVSVIRGAGLELWLDPAVDRATSASDFDFGTFRRSPQSLYIVVQPEHLKTLAPLIRLLFADAIASLQRSQPAADEPHSVMFLMDEFDQLGRQPLVLQSIKTIRSYGGRYFIVSQSLPGLESKDLYSENERRALQAGAGVQIYMTPQDDRTAEVLSKALGNRTVVGKTRSNSAIRSLKDSDNISRRAEEKPLKSPAELLRYDLDKVLVLAEGQYPIEAHHIRYFEDRYFKPIDEARNGHGLPYPLPSVADISFGKRRVDQGAGRAREMAEPQEGRAGGRAQHLSGPEIEQASAELSKSMASLNARAKQQSAKLRTPPKRKL